MASHKKTLEAVEIIKAYNGTNPYINYIKKTYGNAICEEHLNDFQVEYTIENKNSVVIPINKMTRVTDSFASKKQKEWNLEFLPTKIKIISLVGQTPTMYHCCVQYRQSVPPVYCFIPKDVVLKNFLVKDYKDYPVDFGRYNKLMHLKDSNRNLKDHQELGVKFLLARKKCILADSMGLGKTTTLSVAAIEGNFDSVLIICPASLKTNWKNELLWFVPEKDITIIDSLSNKTKEELESWLGYGVGKSGKNRTALTEEAKNTGEWRDNRFVIINYDILDKFYKKPITRSKENIELAYKQSPLLQYLKGKKSCVIVDEAHKLSNATSNRSKLMKDLIKRAELDSLYLATGTPITNNPQNLFCVLSLLDDPITANYGAYMKRYCEGKEMVASQDKDKRDRLEANFLRTKKKTYWGALTEKEKNELSELLHRNCRYILLGGGAANLDELRDRVSHIYLRRDKDSLEGMTEKVVHEVLYDLTPEQKAEYDRLWDEYEKEKLEEDPEKELSKELLEGGIYRRYLALEMVDNTIELTNKLLLEEPDCKVVIFCCFDNEINALKEHFGDKAVIYNGKLNIKQKDKAVNEFQNNENVKIFLGNIIAAGVGITLIRGNKLIFNDMDFVPGNNHQSEDRVHRIGQTKKCDIYYQIFKDTQYEHMWDIVMKKSYNINQVIKTETDKMLLHK